MVLTKVFKKKNKLQKVSSEQSESTLFLSNPNTTNVRGHLQALAAGAATKMTLESLLFGDRDCSLSPTQEHTISEKTFSTQLWPSIKELLRPGL